MSKMMDNLARILDDDEKAVAIKGVPLYLVKGGIVPSADSILANKRARRKRIIIGSGMVLILFACVLALLEESTSLVSNLFLHEVNIPNVAVDEFRTINAKATSSLKEGNWKDASALFTKLLQKFPDAQSPKINLAYAYREMGLYAEAEKILMIVLKNNKDEVNVLNNLAVLYAKKGDFAKAEKILRRVIYLAPNYADAKLNLAFAFEDQHKYFDAIHFFQLYALDPSISPADVQILSERIRRLKSLASSLDSDGEKL